MMAEGSMAGDDSEQMEDVSINSSLNNEHKRTAASDSQPTPHTQPATPEVPTVESAEIDATTLMEEDADIVKSEPLPGAAEKPEVADASEEAPEPTEADAGAETEQGPRPSVGEPPELHIEWLEQELSKCMQEIESSREENRRKQDEIQRLQDEKEAVEEELDTLNASLIRVVEEKSVLESDIKGVRAELDAKAQKEIALTNRLNAAKKKEARESNLAEHYKDDLQALQAQVAEAQTQLATAKDQIVNLETQLRQVRETSQEQVRTAQQALQDERHLNEERKRKMKSFVETRAEELRIAKEDALNLQKEADQSTKALVDLNNRFKQLHAQWVQSQTRNRELQRDYQRLQKDSESWHMLGDSMERKLEKSASQAEEHKHKRMAAKNELMSVLDTLEQERQVSAKLRDSIKFTFVPKALSQQQLMKESLEDLDRELGILAGRLGSTVPPPQGDIFMTDHSEGSILSARTAEEENGEGGTARLMQDSNKLLDKLETESQRVSQGIMVLSTMIERMHMMLASSHRTCIEAALGKLLAPPRPAPEDETRAITGNSRRLGSTQYGQVSRGSIS